MLAAESGIRRHVLTGAVLVGSLWFFHSKAITPLRLLEKDSRKSLAELREHLDSARKSIGEIKDSEREAGKALSELNGLLGPRTEDSVMVSFPESLKEHFLRFGIQVSVVRLNATRDEPDLSGYQRVYWSVGLPVAEADRNATGLLLAVAELEKQDRFIKVVDFALQRDAEDPRLRTASINLLALVRK